MTTATNPIPVHQTRTRRTEIVSLAVKAWEAYGEAVEALQTACTAIVRNEAEVMVRSTWAQGCANRLDIAVDVLAEEAGMDKALVRNDLSRYGANAPRFFSNVREEETAERFEVWYVTRTNGVEKWGRCFGTFPNKAEAEAYRVKHFAGISVRSGVRPVR